MKQFFKTVLATFVGLFLFCLVLCLLTAGIIGTITSLSDKGVEVKPKSVLHIKFDTEIKDRAPSSPLEGFDFMTMKSKRTLGLKEITDALEKAKEDDNIEGILMEVTDVQAGYATVAEIREALADFKLSGKFIVSYNSIYSQKAYYLSSVADSVYLNPEGYLDYRGMKSESAFLKGLLAKIEVEPQLIRHGKYKSAAEPLIQDKMSDANREQVLAFVSSIWNEIVQKISESRKISAEELKLVADSLMLRNATAALEHRFIDGVKFYDEILDEMHKRTGTADKDKINFIELPKYFKAEKKNIEKIAKEQIAVVYAEGDIVDGNGDDDEVGGDAFAKAIREARQNEKVKAVVLRVNSPGGSALASEVILREVLLTKKVKPVIVSMGNVAASGGYYISCAADTIIASPSTITGSIGVFGIIPNAKGFFNNKLGVTFDGVKTNAHSDFPSGVKPLDAFEREALQQEIDRIYDVFITHVSEGRHIGKDNVDSIGQGRVWSGADANKIGLVDAFGGLKSALKIAAKKAGIENYRILELPKRKEPLQQFIKELTGEGEDAYLKAKLGEYYTYFSQIENLKKYCGIQARMPFEIEIQ